MGDTQKSSSRSWINLDPQSSLDVLLGGEEQSVLTADARREIKDVQRDAAWHKERAELFDSKGNTAQAELHRRLAGDLRRKVRDIKSDPGRTQVERSGGYLQGAFRNLVDLAESEENIGDMLRGRRAQLDLANYLDNLTAPTAPELRGPMPGEEEIGYSTQFAQDIFAPQQTQLQQTFADQRRQANRAAAIQGRAGNDPITLARLAESQAREQSLLGSQQTALAAQTARSLPSEFNQIAQQNYQNLLNRQLQNVNYRTQGAAIRQDLGNQALKNRLAVLGVGSSLLGAERQFRLATGEQRNETVQKTSPGAMSIAGGIAGGIGAVAPLFSGGGLAGLAAQQSQQLSAPQASSLPTLQRPTFGQSNPYQPSFQPGFNWR